MDIKPISYYSQRIFLVTISSIFIYLYFVLYGVLVFRFEIIKPSVSLFTALSVESILLVSILMLGSVGGLHRGIHLPGWKMLDPTPQRSFVLLFASTVLFILLVWYPIYIFGGSSESNFSTIMITVSVLMVLVTRSNKVRTLLLSLCTILFLISFFYSYEIEVIRPDLYRIAHVSTVLLSLLLTLFFSYNGGFTLFGDDRALEDSKEE